VVDFLLYIAFGTSEAPLALVPLFHVVNVLMKSLSVLVTDDTKIFREEV
jgi:hypothetical protein